MLKLLAWILDKKAGAAKIGAGLGGAGGILILVMFLHDDVSLKIDRAEARSRSYVEEREKVVVEKINVNNEHLLRGQSEMKGTLKIIEKRVYELKGK